MLNYNTVIVNKERKTKKTACKRYTQIQDDADRLNNTCVTLEIRLGIDICFLLNFFGRSNDENGF